MKVVTFNIRCDYEQDEENSFCYRKPYILQKIVKESPDIICFQEVKVMNAAGEFVDLTGGTDGTFHDYGRQKAEKIDYIFGDSVLICREVTIWDESWNGVYLSDHYPVCVRLKFAAEDKGES